MTTASNVVFGKMRMFGPKPGHATIQVRSMDQIQRWALGVVEVDNQATKFELEVEYGGLRFRVLSVERKDFPKAIEDIFGIDFWTVIGASD